MSQTKAQLISSVVDTDAVFNSTLRISSGTSGDAQLIIESDTDDNNETDNPLIKLLQDGGQLEATIGFGTSAFGNSSGNALAITTGGGSTGAIQFRTSSTGYVANATTKMTLDYTGQLGIGTEDPQAMLHCYTVNEIPAILERDTTGYVNALWLRQDDTTDGNGLKIAYQSDTTGTGALENVDFAGIAFKADIHDQATRAGSIRFLTSQGGVGNLIERAIIGSTGALRLLRNDTSTEGGQIEFTRASDNAVAWVTDVNGSGTNTVYRIYDAVSSEVVLAVGFDCVLILF